MKKILILILNILLLNNNLLIIYSKEKKSDPVIWQDLLVEKIEKNNSILYNTSFRIYNLSNKTIKSISIQFHNYNEENQNLSSNFEVNSSHTATITGNIKPSTTTYVGDLYLTNECKYVHVDKIIIRYAESSKKDILSYNYSYNNCTNCIDFSHYI